MADFDLEFSAKAINADGDVTADVDFVIGIDGDYKGYEGPSGFLMELDMA